MHGNATSEQFHATIADELGVQDRLFWSTRGIVPGGPGGPPQPGAATVNTHIDTWLAMTKASTLDLVMVPVAGDPTWLAALKEEKKAGRVRYIGVQVINAGRFPEIEAVMRSEPIDFIGVPYDLGNRKVEDTILPLAQERKIGVIAFFPLGMNAGTSCGSMSRNLFARVGSTPLPEWAAEFDAKTWAQFFLKYVISHPAVTVARVGTTKAHHMLDDIGGGIGRLPNEAMRKRMAEFIDDIPLEVQPQLLDRYLGEYTATSGLIAIFRRVPRCRPDSRAATARCAASTWPNCAAVTSP
jgi:aryl-alcohol dehydrogenase-like predicted oxidoreductase